MEHIQKMIKAMSDDAGLRDEISGLVQSGDISDIVEAANKRGYDFDDADWQEYADWSNKLNVNKESKQISPDELEDVAGGGGIPEPDLGNMPGECWFYGVDRKSVV